VKLLTYLRDVRKKCTAIAKHSETQLENYQNNVKAGCFECEFNNICNGGCPAHNNVIISSFVMNETHEVAEH
jgi:radical SAM protein with 4Fe4S-binding SPASM domain